METKTVTILLVEDDDVDAESVERALRKHKIVNPIERVKDGIEALEKLRGNGCVPLDRPNLVLLDLNMPRMDGLEFLQEVRHDPGIRDNIIFVLTTSNDDRDKCAAYEKNVAGYLVKSKVGEQFVELVNLLDAYWRYVEFPPDKRRVLRTSDE